MNRFFALIAAAMTLAFGLLAWAPWLTPFSELNREVGVVQDMEMEPYGITHTIFLTSSGITVRCFSGRKVRGCERALMRSLLDSRKPVDLWHNGKRVYQLAVDGKIIFPYEDINEGRATSFAIFFVILMICSVRCAMYFGVFSNHPRGS